MEFCPLLHPPSDETHTPTGQILRHRPGEIGPPAAIAEVVGVEMDRRVVARRVAPAMLLAGPGRTDNRAGRKVDQLPVTRMRPKSR